LIRLVCIVLIVGGVVALVIGSQSFHSFSNDVSRFFTGSPTDKTTWLLGGGAVAVVAGLIGLVTAGRR
jgi:3-oxoacyl-[acyl-carrier-protein] synthase III